jgi:flagellar FliL protein
LKSEIREDVIAFLEGLTVADIEGVRGFQNLREQLDDRAKIRGRGAVLGLLIGGLILE